MDERRTPGNLRLFAGVGVSIALHALLIVAYRHTGTGVPPDVPDAQPLVVFIRPAPDLADPAPALPPPVQAAPPKQAGALARRSARQAAPARVLALPAPPQQAPADPFMVQQSEAAPAEGERTFDLDAAKQTARQLAGQTRLGREGTALAQFPDPPLETESKYAKAISKAKRPNCKDGLPGGLLAPLFLMMDKKDSGCKW
ncbi:hypothetical protein [Massilia sp. H6]|uniref:hypothetical protein n=1 Tax=Massilia sp. H6 TaxID=2970464 RepID=UPI00216A450C|nr:hypothetical protein [Massilia sp. H6]UVW28714.1 hypothetical protein NRS07_00750 [Massilia sp. H6]